MVPRPHTQLPIDDVLAELRTALAHGHAVLCAPPGSGKTTRVPLAMLDAPWLADQAILMLEPRRPAARLAAAHMARLIGDTPGGTVGYQIRFERRVGPSTRIQVITEGILTRRIQGDPELTGVGLLIFDEFHERSLHADLGLALALDTVSALREDLRILVMSATLDAEPVSRLLGGAPVIRGEGRVHPVTIFYRDRPPAGNPADAVAAEVQRALNETEGDVLAFLPGSAEIRRTRERLVPAIGEAVRVLPLHGSMPVREQDRVLRPCRGGERRVVLATDIAETSLTIEGVSAVVDSGLTRKPRFHAGSGLSRLVTEPISLAAAHQRAGRAGRLGPGTCYRLWSRSQESGRPPLRPAEITQADLTPLVLELALWGVSDPARLSWLDPPPPAAWGQAANLLRSLGALDESGSITPFGRSMAEFPVHPRLARMLVGAPPGASRRVAADLAALLSDRDPWLDAPGESRPADLGMRLRALESFRSGASVQWTERSRLAAAGRLSRNLLRNEAQVPERVVLEPGALLALAYPDRVAKRRDGGAGRYLMAGGSGAILPSDDALGLKDLLVIADVEGHQREGRIRLALPIAPAELRSVLGPRIEWVDKIQWDPDRQAVTARREERLGALTLSSRNQPLADPKRSADLLLEQIGKGFDAAFDWGPGVRQLQGRVALMRHLEPNGGWPDLSDDWLRTNPRQWLTPWLAGVQSLADLRALDLAAILRSRLDWAMQRRLDEEAPTELTTPARTRRRLDYTDGENPVLAVPLQEMFGAQATPRICSGRVTVTLHLLSPARRPLQLTRDLSAFWQGSYADVRKEMRGRYPKHHWPERPTEERPVAGGLKRRR